MRTPSQTLIPGFGSCVSLGLVLSVCSALAQPRPYIGYVYPAGGQQGATLTVKLGGQGLDDVDSLLVTGEGVSARVLEYNRALNPQEITLLNEQLREIRRAGESKPAAGPDMMSADTPMKSEGVESRPKGTNDDGPAHTAELIGKLQKRITNCVNRPASAALAHIVYAEVTVSPDAKPGRRELRVGTLRGTSNPLVFYVGQVQEVSRKAMVTAPLQVLGKEDLALRRRPASDVEEEITLPCTANGQIASGEVNRYSFRAQKGQNLVITTQARQLIPFIADAVPGWFQPVLTLYDETGKESAYDDDYRFNPDPTILFKVPKDGRYCLEIRDALYRGREDFVYRITAGELPFITSIFPLGGRAGQVQKPAIEGWNLAGANLRLPATNAPAGIYTIQAVGGLVSNPLPFAIGALPEVYEKENNDSRDHAQEIKLPAVVNGRISRKGDWDVFRISAKSNDVIVAEVSARRLDSPLDSIVKLTDASGNLLAFNDDCEDLIAGANTHDADSWLMATVPASGTYFLHLGDTGANGGDEYGYRLRLSPPQPDFALRIVPSSLAIRSRSSATISVHVIRKDGFTGTIKLALKDAPAGFSAAPVSISGTQSVARLTVKADLRHTDQPVNLSIVGTAKVAGEDTTREAVPAEDRMQAFLWKHLVPASEFKVLVYDPSYQVPPRRVLPARQPVVVDANPAVAMIGDSATNAAPAKSKFTKQQVAGRLRQLKLLFEEGLLTEEFYNRKVAECEASS